MAQALASLLDTLSEDGKSAPFYLKKSGTRFVTLIGDLGGGTLALQVSLDNASFVALTLGGTAPTFDVSDTVQVGLQGGLYYRFSLTGSTNPSVAIYIDGVNVVTKLS